MTKTVYPKLYLSASKVWDIYKVHREGFEPPTNRVETCYSIQLSYRCKLMNIYFYILAAVVLILFAPLVIEVYKLRKTVKSLVKKTSKLVE